MRFILRALLVFVICALLALASGALDPLHLNAASAPSASSRTGTLTFGGIARSYRLYRPADLARGSPVPLVVVLHGGYGNGAGAEAGLHWDRAADAHGFVVPGSETPPPIAVSLIGLEQPSHALDATAVLWDFFASHRL